MNKFYSFLLWITNNEALSKAEEKAIEIKFDIIFVILGFITLISGIYILVIQNTPEWIAFLVLEAIWCLDNIRHNRI